MRSLARRLEVGRTAPRRRLRLLHLGPEARAVREVDPRGARLEGEQAVAEGGGHALGDEDTERDRHLHRRAAHRARHVYEGHELAEIDVLRQRRLQSAERAEGRAVAQGGGRGRAVGRRRGG